MSKTRTTTTRRRKGRVEGNGSKSRNKRPLVTGRQVRTVRIVQQFACVSLLLLPIVIRRVHTVQATIAISTGEYSRP